MISAGNTKGRHVFSIDFHNSKHHLGFEIGKYYQYFSTENNKWNDTHTNNVYLCINLKRWYWGSEHYYYDGPHCSFSIGPVHFCWGPDWCAKCMPDDE